MKIFNKDYIFNWAEETAWAVILGAVAVVGPMLVTLDADTIGVYGAEEWETWGLALVVAVGRVVGAIIINSLRMLFTKE